LPIGVISCIFWAVNNRFPRLLPTAAACILALSACSYLPTDSTVNDGVTVTETRDAIVVQSASGDTHAVGFLFCPGALVDPHAYLPWLSDLAATGIPVVVAKEPGNLAVLSPDAGLALMSLVPSAAGWVIGGHSLGGAMAAWSAYGHPAAYAGMVLLAAYPSESRSLAAWARPVLSLSASNDGLATPAKAAAAEPLLPEPRLTVTGTGQYAAAEGGYTVLHEITGGNHAQFGGYGPQDGDGGASISAESQHAEVVAFIAEFFSVNGW
jgi:pimeloyl-ACP methyl ester carboxylesterase